MSPVMELLKIDHNRLEDVYKSYKINQKRIERDVEILKEWLKKQPHLPHKLPYDEFLEQMLKNNKYRIEQTKERIDSYFTLKNLILETFKGLASDDSIFPTQTSVGVGISPFFLDNNENIGIAYIKTSDPDLFDFEKFLQALVAFCEIYLRYNYAASVRFVIEIKKFSFGQFKKFDLIKYRNLFKLVLDGYGFRIAGIYFLNFPVYCGPVITLIKSISSAKMFSRIHFINNLESLHKNVPKHVLPEELGGTAKYTMEELADKTDLIFQNQRSFLASSVNYLSNEKLRIGKSKYNDMFGVDGTFKQMNLD